MIKQTNQLNLSFSKHSELYDILISSDNMWRQMNDMIDFSFVVEMLKDKNNFWRQLKNMVDFSFVYDELKDKYSSTMGRTCEDVIRMFKYLLLKSYFKLSDRGLVERTKTDMLFKYFLGYEPEELKLIDPSTLTVFRRERLIDEEENLMDKQLK